METTEVAHNFHLIHARIQQAALAYQRDPASIQLLAVSKMQPLSALRSAIACGQQHFGENYAQDALEKITALNNPSLVWHFIGAIQSNKTRLLAEHFAWIETLASLKHAQRLNEQRPPQLPPLNVCIQVNLHDEPQKAGVKAAAVAELAQAIRQLPRLRLRGLMTIPAYQSDFAQQRQAHRALAFLRDTLENQGIQLDTLSMGMSDDLEAAIAEGATQVRIGTALFGTRLAK